MKYKDELDVGKELDQPGHYEYEDQLDENMIMMEEEGEGLSHMATDMIMNEHDRLREMFGEADTLNDNPSPDANTMLIEQALLSLQVMIQLKEEVFYPRVRPILDEEGRQVLVHLGERMKRLQTVISDLRGTQPGSLDQEQVWQQLALETTEYMVEEEATLLPLVEEDMGEELVSLGQDMLARRQEIMSGGQSMAPLATDRMITSMDSTDTPSDI